MQSKESRKHWSNQETVDLKKFFPTRNYKELVEKFPRHSIKSINGKAYKLNLKKYILKYRSRHYQSRPIKMTQVERSYWAGFFDGEGSIGLRRFKYLVVTLGNTEKSIMKKAKRRFGGTLYRYERGGRFKPIYHWTAVCLIAERFLRIVFPYLIVKKKKAEIALRYRSTMGVPGQTTGTLTKQRDTLVKKLLQLKRITY